MLKLVEFLQRGRELIDHSENFCPAHIRLGKGEEIILQDAEDPQSFTYNNDGTSEDFNKVLIIIIV